MSTFYPEEVVHERLTFFPGWDYGENFITKKFEFEDFITAFAFMTIIAILAEKVNHHPEWTNVYNSLVIKLSTHEAGGITDKDFSLAKEIDKQYARYSSGQNK